MPRRLAALMLLALVPVVRGQDLQTVAEKTDYKATSRHSDSAATPMCSRPVWIFTACMTGCPRSMPHNSRMLWSETASPKLI